MCCKTNKSEGGGEKWNQIRKQLNRVKMALSTGWKQNQKTQKWKNLTRECDRGIKIVKINIEPEIPKM